MKKTCALMLSLMLLMAQFVFAAPTCTAAAVPAVRTAKHSCCAPVRLACNAACCVARDSAPRASSVPAPPPAAPRASHFVAALLVALWTLPALAEISASASASSSAAVSTPAVPLFLRHGTLLI